MNVKGIDKNKSNNFDDYVNIIESYIQLNREQQAKDMIKKLKNYKKNEQKIVLKCLRINISANNLEWDKVIQELNEINQIILSMKFNKH